MPESPQDLTLVLAPSTHHQASHGSQVTFPRGESPVSLVSPPHDSEAWMMPSYSKDRQPSFTQAPQRRISKDNHITNPMAALIRQWKWQLPMQRRLPDYGAAPFDLDGLDSRQSRMANTPESSPETA